MMKRILHITYVLIFISCSQKKEEKKELNSEIPKNSSEVNLEKYFLPILLHLPDKSFADVEINELNGSTRIRVEDANTFDVHDVPPMYIEIAYGGDLVIKKQDLKDDLVFKNEILSEKEDCIIYSSSLKDNSKTYFHFYAVKNLDGENYEIFDIFEDTQFTKKQIEKMVEYVNTLKSAKGVKQEVVLTN